MSKPEHDPAPPAGPAAHEPLFVCKDTGLATFSCPYCHAHVHRGEASCAQCGKQLHLMAQQLYWGPVLFNEALLRVRYGDYNRARSLLHGARRLMPDRAEPYTLLAKLEAYDGRDEQARSWIAEARERGLVPAATAEKLLLALDGIDDAQSKAPWSGGPLRRIADWWRTRGGTTRKEDD